MDNTPIVIEQTYNAPASRVWQALTKLEQMRQWYFDIPAFRPEVGFEFQFTGGTEDKKFLHRCQITEVIPERKLSHTWQYEGYEGDTEVSIELFPEGEKTHVVLTHAGLDSLPKQEEFVRSNFNDGWNHILGTSLKYFVEAQ